MKSVFIFFTIAAFCISACSCSEEAKNTPLPAPEKPQEQNPGGNSEELFPKDDGVLRLATYNIGALQKSSKTGTALIASMMTELKADVISFNEVDKNVPRSGNVDQLDRIVSGMEEYEYVFAKAINIGNGEYMTDDYVVEDAVYSSREEFRRNAYKLFDKNLLYTPWNKLFEAKYIMENNLRFPTTFWDDFPFNLSIVRDVERVTVTSGQYYHFLRARTESETAAYRPGMYEKREEEHGWMLELYRYWKVADHASTEMVARRYVERFIGCVENVTNPKSGMSEKEKRQEIRKMLENPRLDKSLKVARPRSGYMKIMLLPIRWKSTLLTYLEAKVITFVKTKNTKLFTKLKVGR